MRNNDELGMMNPEFIVHHSEFIVGYEVSIPTCRDSEGLKDATCSNSTIHMKPVFDIVSEPKAQTYIDLLNFAASRCKSFSLVWRDQRHENSALEIKHALKPFILSNVRTDEWPGTKLIGHEAIVRRYRVADESMKLLQTAGSLYSWLEPHLPEDLTFYSSGDVVWLVSISHENQAWLLEESLSTAEVYAYVPRLKIKPHTECWSF